MTKTYALHLILHAGRSEQYDLAAAGRRTDAYQIEAARNRLLFAMLDSVKEMRRVLDLMVDYNPDTAEGAIAYIGDDLARSIFARLRRDLGKR